MRCLILSLSILFSVAANAQCRTFRISSKGDTLDCVDMKGLKQGKWLVKVAPLRGEPGYEEEGAFVNDKKEGLWRRYNLMGDPLAEENYKWGNKNGRCIYFTLTGPEREESWRAFNPTKTYDTLDIQDLKDPNKYEQVIVKVDGRSMRHGTWKYYYPLTGALVKTEKYVLDQLQEPGAEDMTKNLPRVNGTTSPATSDTTTKAKTAAVPDKAKSKPKEVLEFEKKTSGKKKALRDGRTGG
jgi:hypothetical protein